MNASESQYALATRAECWTLRLLLEVVIANMDRQSQEIILRAFHTASESSIASLLAHASQEATLQAFSEAVQAQRRRLAERLQIPDTQLPPA